MKRDKGQLNEQDKITFNSMIKEQEDLLALHLKKEHSIKILNGLEIMIGPFHWPFSLQKIKSGLVKQIP